MVQTNQEQAVLCEKITRVTQFQSLNPQIPIPTIFSTFK